MSHENAKATIMSGSRNFKGRMGTAAASIYLSNPYMVAASALARRLQIQENIFEPPSIGCV